MTEKLRKKLITALKIVISILLIYFIFTKIDFKNVLSVLKTTKPLYLLLALLAFVASKILNAFRLNCYFHQIGAFLTHASNLKLYLLGMFYNLFLPGGIGGDAYKGYVIEKRFKTGAKKVIAALLLDRLSGMLLIFVFACSIALMLQHSLWEDFRGLLILAIPLSVIAFWWVNRQFFRYLLPVFWSSFGYSIFIQLFQLISVYFILKSLSIEASLLTYQLIFLVSSIVSVLPLTIGGIGSREITFLYGSKWLQLNADTAVAISMVFFLITAFVSMVGIVYHFKKPELSISKDVSNVAH